MIPARSARRYGEETLVSVVIPVHNREAVLPRAISSVLEQDHEALDVIVVDDCSTDESAEVAAAWARRDPRLRLIRLPENRGAGGARNAGIAEARGELVAFQDSDDRWLPEKLSRQIEALDAARDCAACYCGAVYLGSDHCYYIPRRGTIGRCDGDIFADLLTSNPTTPQTLLVERDLLFRVGLFDESLRINEDWDLALRISRAGRFAFVPDRLAMIYSTPGSVSSHLARDADFRARLLELYASDYARHRTARGRQNYILGGQRLALGDYDLAFRHFLASMRDVPTPRCAAQLARIPLRWAHRRRQAP